jgi:ABC transporter substrate binding protein
MRVIGLAVVLALDLALAPLAGEAQQAEKIYRSATSHRDPASSTGTRRFDKLSASADTLKVGILSSSGDSPRVARSLLSWSPSWSDSDWTALLSRASVQSLRSRRRPPQSRSLSETLTLIRSEEGLVASFPCPGGNITGITGIAYDLASKRLELLKEAMPGLSRVAMLIAPSRAADAHVRVAAPTARNLGIERHSGGGAISR